MTFKTALVTHLAAWLIGVCSGFALAAWLLIEPVRAGETKYHLRDFAKKPPVIRINEYGHEPKRWEFRCVGSEKDCGRPTPVPEPSTLVLLVAGGLAWRGARRWM